MIIQYQNKTLYSSIIPGYRERDRPLCCDNRHDLYQCLEACGRDINGFEETSYCGGVCFNGAPSVVYPKTCSCSDAFYGSCCEKRTHVTPSI